VTSVSDKIALAINMIMGISLTTTLHIIKQKEKEIIILNLPHPDHQNE